MRAECSLCIWLYQARKTPFLALARGHQKPLKRPIRALEGRTTSNPRLGPLRGLRRPPRGLYGRGMDSQTFGGLRTPACGWTPTGAGPTASPRLRRGFGHLLAMIGGRNPAPSRDAATTSTLVCRRRRACHQVGGGQGSRAAIGRAEPLPLTPEQLRTRYRKGVGLGSSTPPPDDRGRSAGFGAEPQGLPSKMGFFRRRRARVGEPNS